MDMRKIIHTSAPKGAITTTYITDNRMPHLHNVSDLNINVMNPMQISIQKLLVKKFAETFITLKPVNVSNIRIPAGAVSKVLSSEKEISKCVCAFAAPYRGIEICSNPLTDLCFGKVVL